MSYKSFLFLILLLLVGLFGYLRYQANGSPDSAFNQNRRYSLGKSEFWRSVLGLKKPGDAKGQFLIGGQPIIIEAVTTKGLEINGEGLGKFAAEVERITGRKTSIINVDTTDLAVINDAALPELVSNYRRHKTFGQPSIFVVYASKFEGSDETPSKAFNSFGILVSDEKLKDITSGFSQSVRDYLPAVMLNSFGQQLGLSTSQNPDCIMQEAVLKPTRAISFYGKVLPSSYCDAEIEQAGNIRKVLQ